MYTIIELEKFIPGKSNFKVPEVADFFNVSESFIKSLCRLGELEAVKVGREWRISREALNNYIYENTNNPDIYNKGFQSGSKYSNK